MLIRLFQVSTSPRAGTPVAPEQMGPCRNNRISICLLVAGGMVALSAFAAGKDEHSVRVGDLLITATGIETPESARANPRGGSPSRPTAGYYLVAVHVSLRNVGKKRAICPDFDTRLKANFGLDYHRSLGLDVAPESRPAGELLPGEETHDAFTFRVKDGAEARAIVIEHVNLGCGSDRGSYFTQKFGIPLDGLQKPVREQN